MKKVKDTDHFDISEVIICNVCETMYWYPEDDDPDLNLVDPNSEEEFICKKCLTKNED